MRKTRYGALIALLTGLLLTLGLAASANAATTATATPHATTAQLFAARALHEGLTTMQISQIQQKVDRFIARNGGTQVALNKVNFAGGDIVFGVPGESARQAATTDAGTVVPYDSTCSYLHFCGWQGDNYTGSKISLFTCGHYTTIPWGSGGSWKNNQSPGTRAYMYGSSHNRIYTTPGAYSADAHANWKPVYYVRPC